MEHSWEMELQKPIGVSLDPTDMRQVFFTNLLLLGFDTGAMESRYKIPFNRDMFALPNKKAFEVVIHFLFNKLDPVLCRETFRDCWPVIDKKVEQQFRKACNNWLTMISKEEKDAHLPRIVASTFMSPGGDRFYQLMFSFSMYVILRTIKTEHGMKSRDMLEHPVLTPQNLAIDHVMSEGMKCGAVRHRKRFLEQVEDTMHVQQEWKGYASELVKEHRTLSKAIRDKERLVRDEIQRGTTMRGSPVPKRRSGIHDPELDVQSVKRAQKVQKVRELWKILEDFNESKEQEREVIESILKGTLDQFKIDSGLVNVKIPDLLLRECENELQRRNIDNTFKGGKLNLLSLVHLWNLSLHLYIEKLHAAGVPNFDDHLATVATQVHTHHAYLSNTQALRSKMSKELIPNVKASIDQLKHSLDQQPLKGKTPHTIKTTSLGLGLLPPTPPMSFQEDATLTAATPPSISATLTPNKVSTPEAVSRLVNSVEKTVRREQASLGAGTPLYGPKLGIKGQPYGADSVSSRLPVPTVQVERVGNKQRTMVRSAPGQQRTPSGVSHSASRSASHGASHVTPAGTSPLVIDARNNMFETIEMETTGEAQSTRVSARGKLTEQVSKVKPGRSSAQKDRTPLSNRKKHQKTSSPRAHDILADKIVDALMESGRQYTSGLSSGESTPDPLADINLQDPLEGLGTEAFKPKDKIARTPEGAQGRKMTWHETLMEEQVSRRPSQTELDEVTKNLFTPDNSDEENIITVGEIPEEKYVSPPPRKTPSQQPKVTTPSSGRRPRQHATLLDMDTVFGGQDMNRSAREVEERLEAVSEVTNQLKDPHEAHDKYKVQEDRSWRRGSTSSSEQSSSVVSDVVRKRDSYINDSPLSTEEQYRELFESKTPYLPIRVNKHNNRRQLETVTPEPLKSSVRPGKLHQVEEPVSERKMPFSQFTEVEDQGGLLKGFPQDTFGIDDEDEDLLTAVTMPFSPFSEDSPISKPQDVQMVVSPHIFELEGEELRSELRNDKAKTEDAVRQTTNGSHVRSRSSSSTGSSVGFSVGHKDELAQQSNNMKYVEKDSSVEDLISRYRKLKLNNLTTGELSGDKSNNLPLSKHMNGSTLSSNQSRSPQTLHAEDAIDPRYFVKSPVLKTVLDEKFSLDLDQFENKNVLNSGSFGAHKLPDSPEIQLMGQEARTVENTKPTQIFNLEKQEQRMRSPQGFTLPASPLQQASLSDEARGGYLQTPRHRESLPLDGSLIDVDAMLSPGIGETPGLPFGRRGSGRGQTGARRTSKIDTFDGLLDGEDFPLLPSSPGFGSPAHSPAVGNLLDF